MTVAWAEPRLRELLLVRIKETPFKVDRFLRTNYPTLLILVLSGVLNFWGLGSLGYNGDEGVYSGQAAILAGNSWMKNFFLPISRADTNFLFYQGVVSVGFRLFGQSDVVAKGVSATFGVLTVLFVFLMGRRVYGRKEGLIASFFAALSTPLVLLDKQAHLDAMLTFFFVLSLYFFARYLDERKDGLMAPVALFAFMAFVTKVTGVLAIVVVLLTLRLTVGLRSSRRALMIGVSSVVPLIALLGVFVLENLSEFRTFFANSTSRVTPVSPLVYLPFIFYSLGVFVPLLGVLGAYEAIRTRKPTQLLILTWVVVVVTFFTVYPAKSAPYVLPAIPAIALLAGAGVAKLPLPQDSTKVWRLGKEALALGTAITIPAATLAYASIPVAVGQSSSPYNPYHYDGLKDASLWLKAHAHGKGVLVMTFGVAHVVSFYSGLPAYPLKNPGGVFYLPTAHSDGTLSGSVHLTNSTINLIDMVNRSQISYYAWTAGAGVDASMNRQVVSLFSASQLARFGQTTVYHLHYNQTRLCNNGGIAIPQNYTVVAPCKAVFGKLLSVAAMRNGTQSFVFALNPSSRILGQPDINVFVQRGTSNTVVPRVGDVLSLVGTPAASPDYPAQGRLTFYCWVLFDYNRGT